MKRSVFLKVLDDIKPGIAKKELIDNTTKVSFINNTAVSFNDEICVVAPCLLDDITCSVSFNELHALMTQIQEENISIRKTEKELQICTKTMSVGLPIQPVLLPINFLKKKINWELIPEPNMFLEALKFTANACATDMNSPILTCVNITADGFLEASDGYKATRYDTGFDFPINTLIPSTTVNILYKYENVQHVAKSIRGWVLFKTTSNLIFCCRELSEDIFPDMNHVLKVSGINYTFPDGIETLLNKTQIFTKKETIFDTNVLLEITPNTLKCSIKKGNVGWFHEEIQNPSNITKNISIYINPSYIKDILKYSKKCRIGKTSMLFIGKNWEHVIVLKNKEGS